MGAGLDHRLVRGGGGEDPVARRQFARPGTTRVAGSVQPFLLSAGDLASVKRDNAHFSDDLLSTLALPYISTGERSDADARGVDVMGPATPEERRERPAEYENRSHPSR